MEITLLRFVQALRNAEVRVSPAETLDAFDIVQRIGVGNEQLLKDALALVLAKSPDEKTHFEDTFQRFFFQLAFREPAKRTFLRDLDDSKREALLRGLTENTSATLAAAVASVLNDDRDSLALRVQQAASEIGIHRIESLREKSQYAERIAEALAVDQLSDYLAAHGGGSGDGLLRYLRQYFQQEIRAYVDAQYRLHVDASGKRKLIEAALAANLDQLPRAYHDDVRRVVEKLAARLASEHRRRRKVANRGQLDIKKTLRRNLAYDGAYFDLHWRQRKREQATVFVLCDVSSSVARVARFLLLFLYQLTDVLPSVRAFAFSARLGEITAVMRGRPSEAAIEDALFTWGKGNTDYARAFLDFRDLCATDINPHSTLIVLGDARNNYYDPRPKVFEQLCRRAKQAFWLNPEARDQWREGDSEMRRYAPYCFRVDTCNKLRHIERFADRLLLATR